MPLVHPPAQRRASFATIALLTGVLAAAALCSPLVAEGEYMVQDLGQADLLSAAWSWALPVSVTVDGVAYFDVDDGVHGFELWRSDGTAFGTFMVKDVCPGICGGESFSGRFDLAALGSFVFFSANDGVAGSELWVTDGTTSGTRRVADVRPGPQSSEPSDFHAAYGRLYFLADDGRHGRRLWRSDGTASGTQLVLDPANDPLGTSVESITSGNGVLYLRVGSELWRSDGTLAGTYLLHPGLDLPTGFGWQGAARTLPDGVLIFSGCASTVPAADCEPWRTDGTLAGTYRLADLMPGSESSSSTGFVPVGSEVWFSAFTPDGTGSRRTLFRTDGTVGGTLAIPMPPGTEGRGASYSLAAPLGSSLVFMGWDADHGAEPWITDGVTSRRIADLWPGPDSSLSFSPAFDRPRFVSLGGRVLFLADDGSSGTQLWSTDGSAAGTQPVSDLGGVTAESYFGYYPSFVPPALTSDSDLIFHFRPDLGLRLWRSDGTLLGTFPITTIEDRSLGYVHAVNNLGSPGPFRCLTPLRQGVVARFVSTIFAGAAQADLVTTDGVPGGVVDLGSIDDAGWGNGVDCEGNDVAVLVNSRLADAEELQTTTGFALSPLLPSSVHSRPVFEHLGDRLLFAGGDPASGGTSTLFSVPRGATSADDIIRVPLTLTWGTLASAASQAFFAADGGLEVSDAETSSTLLIPSDFATSVSDLTSAGDALFFVYDTPEEGPELWSSDGSLIGTREVLALVPGPVGGLPEPELRQRWRWPWESRIAALSPGHVVFAGDDGVSGNELWRSDGTAAGTLLVADLDPGPDGSWPRHLTALGNGVVLLAAEDPSLGLELYRTDGTAAGTWMVRDIVPGAGSSVPDDFAVEDGVLYFSAWTPADGRELWRSDGTFAGTYRLTDIAPGPLSSSPSKFTRAGNRLFFLASDNVHGFELWARADDGSVPLFIDGFETGDTTRWSQTLP
jgi:ELWxxDGT repeat protein